ncbi:C4L/C10L family protein [Flamingopox virus FGPVKD09]|uniref:C4L/C10L family protein n=1 Tax=Flamingopox virus FGPVKD09 TaxID=2059380 RepID=A0A2H4X2S6_9POXV|nr:C4L/C10L family protein [Flamingopox virus FGPVKD09]AUD40362.1 C4L/C10L family protein [Flamingopox virus FGPVKD09]
MMGFTCVGVNSQLAVHRFTETYFTSFKKELLVRLGISNLDDIKNISEDSKIFFPEKGMELLSIKDRKSKQIVFEKSLDDDLLKKLHTLIYNELSTLVDSVTIDNTVTLIMYEEGDYFAKHRDFSTIFSKNIICVHLLLYLEQPEIGGETVIYIDNNTSMKLKTDHLFDKTIEHESLIVESGRKCVALFDVFLEKKLSTSTNVIGSIEYLGKKINLYDRENDLQLCYCDMVIERMTEDEEYSLGMISDRSGRCIKSHHDGSIVRYCKEYGSFDDLCIFNMDELDEVWMSDKKHIMWSTIDEETGTSFIPIDPILYEKLKAISSKEHREHKDLRGFCNSRTEYICCSVSKYYFNLPTKTDLIYEVINSTNSDIKPTDTPNWCTLPIEVKQTILDNMSYEELFHLVRGKIDLEENNEYDIYA